MASASVLSSIRRRRLPSTSSFFAPVGGLGLIQGVESIASDVVSAVKPTIPFQKKNIRSLIGKVEFFLSFFESLRREQSPPVSQLSSAANLCFKELYIVIYRCKILLDYCNDSSILWLLLQNYQISSYFHALTIEISTLVEVFPFDEFSISTDVREQSELLRKQARRSKQYTDPRDEKLRLKIHSFLDDFQNERLPNEDKLRATFINQLGIRDAETCKMEIEFLEEQIYGQEEDVNFMVFSDAIALTRYCRFLLFGFGSGAGGRKIKSCRNNIEAVAWQGIGENFPTSPKEFYCPISLELMRDPVIVSTGQTYERSSIVRWLDEGHNTCPNSGLTLANIDLVPNRALQSLITLWCAAHGVSYEPSQNFDASEASVSGTIVSKAALGANKATANLLIQQLSVGSEDSKEVAVHELRLLAKTWKENRAYIGEAGAIPLLRRLLSSSIPSTQENSVTAILNLSILEANKRLIMEEEGCLKSIVNVLRHGLTEEARENAAATLFSLSLVHEYKKRITDEEGTVESLAGLLRDGSLRGKKDAVMGLFNLSTCLENCKRMVESGVVSALAGALGTEEVADEASKALALLVRGRSASEAIAQEENAVMSLVGLIKRGNPKSKENAIATLVAMCRSGGAVMTAKVASTPAIFGLIHTLLFTGTKRARRKALSLVRLFQRYEACASTPLGGLALQYALARNHHASRQSTNHDNSDVSVSVPVSLSVPVL